MADRDQEERLRDLKKRVELEPRSRFFVPLAEEYRKAGRLPDAIQALENGLEAHPGHVAARVALARAFLETGRIEDSVAAFSRVLDDDPSNLVAAKALGDIHLSRGEPMEALKKYLRFRAVSGDRRMDEVIAKLREEAGPPPEAVPAPAPPVVALPARIEPAQAPAPPPLMVSPFPAIDLSPPSPPRRQTDPFDITSVPYAPPPEPGPIVSEPAEQMLSRDVRLDGIPHPDAPESEEIVARRIRLPESSWPFEPTPEEPPLPAAVGGTREAATPVEPAAAGEPVAAASSGHTLVDLSDEQGHHDDAFDAGRERRLAKIRLLNQWLAAVQTRSRR